MCVLAIYYKHYRRFMSGKVSDNLGRSSGLTKAASTGDPTATAGDPATDRDEAVGTRYINTTSGELFICTDASAGENIWKGQLGTTVEVAKYYGSRGVWVGGRVSDAMRDEMDYVTIASLGNASDFGNLQAAKGYGCAVSNGSRGLDMGGEDGNNINVIDYWTFASLGNAADFGDLTQARRHTHDGRGSNGTRGLCCGGYVAGDVDTVDYVNIASLGNAIDFGNLSGARREIAGANNDTRLCIAGGYESGNVDTIDYFTMDTTGNAVDFGDLATGDSAGAGCSNGVRGLHWSSSDDEIQFYVIASLGNATDFGNQVTDQDTYGSSACSDLTKGVMAGGGSGLDTMDVVNIASSGDATDFGDLTVGRYAIASASGT